MKLVIENLELVLAMDNLMVSLATLLTAVFTCVAAFASMKAVKVASNSYSEQSQQYRLDEFHKLLGNLERGHGVCFLQRGTLFERMKAEKEICHQYENFIAMVNNGFRLKQEGHDVNHFLAYVSFAERISSLFAFEYIAPLGSEHILEENSGRVFPIRKNNPNWIGESANTIAREIILFCGIDVSLEINDMTIISKDGGYEELKSKGKMYSYLVVKNDS
ncbi:hypothetical protein [Vibrio tasmaniensis]|uniref:hypothetical protein n=1 Tax=Vibrio tasmaniensis TaxID=212663 RepID=UPI000368A812|nr:hypothetical protein [Vibrio tasmaniensis]OEF88069.1 hypothetical protein A162_07990 [Vibrio tasmaniensis 1F-155]